MACSQNGREENFEMNRQIGVLTLLLAAVASAFGYQRADRGAIDRSSGRLMREVRHELVMLPYYGVFDNLAYRVDGNTVTLEGQVTRPTLKSDAENVVKNVEGVQHVVNNIQV